MEGPWVPRELRAWDSTEFHAGRPRPPPALAPFNLGGQVGARYPQKAGSNPLERGMGSGEQGFLRPRLLCWVGSAGRPPKLPSSGQRLCGPWLQREIYSISRPGAGVQLSPAGVGRLRDKDKEGIRKVEKSRGVCFPETLAPGGWSWCTGAQGTHGSLLLFPRPQDERQPPTLSPGGLLCSYVTFKGVSVPLPCSYYPSIVTSPLVSHPTGSPWQS